MSESDRYYTLITGASSGLGRAIALRFSGQRRLILGGRNPQRLRETLSCCENSTEHFIWEHDLSDVGQIAQSLCTMITENGLAIGSFVHAAGILKILPVRAVNHRIFTEVLNTNLVSAAEIISLLVKRRVNRGMLKNILFISSIVSNFGAPGFSMYAASKSALDGLMRALAVELAPHVRVNSILPGGLRTPMTENMLADTDVMERLVRDYPLGLGEIGDIVNAVEFLSSPASRWTTGQEFVVDGGRSINIAI